MAILPSSDPLNRSPGVLCKSSGLPGGHPVQPRRPRLTSLLVQLVARVTRRLKDTNDDNIVSILQELLDLLQGQNLLGGRPGLLDHVVHNPWGQSTRLRAGAPGGAARRPHPPGSFPAPPRKQPPYRISPVGRCNQKASPCGRSSGSGSRRHRTSWPGPFPQWRRPSPGGLGESACSVPWQPSHTRGPVSCSVHTCQSKPVVRGLFQHGHTSPLGEVQKPSLCSQLRQIQPTGDPSGDARMTSLPPVAHTHQEHADVYTHTHACNWDME